MYGSGLQHNESLILDITGELLSCLKAEYGKKVLVMDYITKSLSGIICCIAHGHERHQRS